jgi:D-alanyl-D-alanine endopeptidase (penicillin-binding protein 7)
MTVSKGCVLNPLLNIVAKCICVLGLATALAAVTAQAAAVKPVAKKPAAAAKAAGKSAGKKPALAAKQRGASKLSAKASAKASTKVPASGKLASGKVQRTTAQPVRGQKTMLVKVRGQREVQRVVVRGKNGKRMVVMRPVRASRAIVLVAAIPPKPSFGQLAGLHGMQDELDLKSSVALVIDQDTREVLFSKNDAAVLPIASLTKLMTGVVVSEARLDMNELIAITQDDVDTEKGSRSRLGVGTELPRGELMLLALMSSENRAAHALGRTYPGGMAKFVQQMNAKAAQLGMLGTRYVEPTGLSSNNQSSAQDLALLVGYASNNSQLRQLSTAPDHQIAIGEKTLNFVNTNRLIRNPEWEIGLQKTGYISEAGQCLVMQAKIAGRKLIMVFLDSAGKLSRLGDAERVRKWVENKSLAAPVPVSVLTKPLPG